MSYTNDTKPVLETETWATITETWAAETRTWAAMKSDYTNDTKPS